MFFWDTEDISTEKVNYYENDDQNSECFLLNLKYKLIFITIAIVGNGSALIVIPM